MKEHRERRRKVVPGPGREEGRDAAEHEQRDHVVLVHGVGPVEGGEAASLDGQGQRGEHERGLKTDSEWVGRWVIRPRDG